MQASKVTVTKQGSTKPQTEAYKLSFLFIEGEKNWSAQCLEYDIAAQAGTFNDLFYELERVLVSQIALDIELGREPFEGIGKAPKKYWEAFRRSQTTMNRPSVGLKSDKATRPKIRPTIKVAEQAA